MTKPSVPRLKDVAEEAEVSVGAASRILRGDTAPFGKDTAVRVVEAAKRLGWRRNLLVNGIQTGRTKTVGVMIPPFDSFWINVMSGIHNRLAEADYLPITVWLGDLDKQPFFEEGDEEGIAQINRLLDRRVDALIMWPQIACSFRKSLAQATKQNVPLVVIDWHGEDPLGDSVVTAGENSTRIVADHLLKLGHRRFGCLSERDDDSHSWAKARVHHFQQAINEVDGTELVTMHLGAKGDDGVEVATKLLQQKSPPTAIFAVSDHLANDVYLAAKKVGLRIPEDLSVVGFSDLDFAVKMSPQLTTVHQHPKKVGVKAVDIVLKRIESKQLPDKFESIEIDGELVLRNSTAAPRKS
jgi:LacI family transcriptional regulator